MYTRLSAGALALLLSIKRSSATCSAVHYDGIPLWPLNVCIGDTHHEDLGQVSSFSYCANDTLMYKYWASADCSGTALGDDEWDSEWGGDFDCSVDQICEYAAIEMRDMDPELGCGDEISEHYYITDECSDSGNGTHSSLSCDDDRIRATIYSDSECSGDVLQELDIWHTNWPWAECSAVQCPNPINISSIYTTSTPYHFSTTTTTSPMTTNHSTTATCAAIYFHGLPFWPMNVCMSDTHHEDLGQMSSLVHCVNDTPMYQYWESADCSGPALGDDEFAANWTGFVDCSVEHLCEYATLVIQDSDPAECDGETTEYAYIINECTDIGGGEYSVTSCDDESIRERIYTDSECSGAVMEERDFFHTSMEDCASIQCPTTTTTSPMTTNHSTTATCAAMYHEGLPFWPMNICMGDTHYEELGQMSSLSYCANGTPMYKYWASADCSGQALGDDEFPADWTAFVDCSVERACEYAMLLVQHSDPEDPFTDCNGETTEYAYILNECTNIGGGEYSVFSCDDESIQETIYTDSECSGAVVSEHDFYHTSMEDCASIQCPTSLTGPTLPATDAMDDEPTTTTTTTSTTDLSCAAVIDEGLPRWPLGSCFTTSEKTSEQFVCHQDGSLIHKKWQTHDCSGSAVMELKEMDGLGYSANCDVTETCTIATVKQLGHQWDGLSLTCDETKFEMETHVVNVCVKSDGVNAIVDAAIVEPTISSAIKQCDTDTGLVVHYFSDEECAGSPMTSIPIATSSQCVVIDCDATGVVTSSAYTPRVLGILCAVAALIGLV